jgi:hypothetical protein
MVGEGGLWFIIRKEAHQPLDRRTRITLKALWNRALFIHSEALLLVTKLSHSMSKYLLYRMSQTVLQHNKVMCLCKTACIFNIRTRLRVVFREGIYVDNHYHTPDRIVGLTVPQTHSQARTIAVENTASHFTV